MTLMLIVMSSLICIKRVFKMWKCQRCDEKFDTEKQLERHQQDETICSACCSNRIKFERETNSYYCKSCGK
jgi:hypothetical protein